MILTQNDLPKYFAIADATSSWFDVPTNTFNFVNNGSKTLLVTIGDSWTWGSDISLNDNIRINSLYGKLLSDSIGTDWLNLGLCNTGNFWLAEKVEELGKIIPKLEYDSIYVICVFTEVGRWFNTKYDRNIDYINWFKSHTNYNDLLIMLNRVCVKRIQSALKKFTSVKLKIGTHFVDPIGMELLPKENLIPKMWINIMGYNTTDYVPTIMYGIEPLTQALEFISYENHFSYKQWILDLYEKSEPRLAILKDAKNFVNCHPGMSGHKSWAKYLEGIL